MRTSASGAQGRPAWPSSSIQGMSSGRMPSVPIEQQVAGREAHEVLGLRTDLRSLDPVRAMARSDESDGFTSSAHCMITWKGLPTRICVFDLDVGDTPAPSPRRA